MINMSTSENSSVPIVTSCRNKLDKQIYNFLVPISQLDATSYLSTVTTWKGPPFRNLTESLY